MKYIICNNYRPCLGELQQHDTLWVTPISHTIILYKFQLIYSWASDSCWTNLNRRGDLIDPWATSGFRGPINDKCLRIKRDTKICGRFCHSSITSFGVLTWTNNGFYAVSRDLICIMFTNNLPDRLLICPTEWHRQLQPEFLHDVLMHRILSIPFQC